MDITYYVIFNVFPILIHEVCYIYCLSHFNLCLDEYGHATLIQHLDSQNFRLCWNFTYGFRARYI